MRYALAEIELTCPIQPLQVGEDEQGAGVLVRYGGHPITFFMVPLQPQVLPVGQLERLLLEHAGVEITTELLRREFAPAILQKQLPPVTVGICTRDHPDYVARVVRSLLASAAHSTIENQFEILVVDNAPSDQRTRKVAESFSDVRYVCERRPGLDFARNRAVQEARGEILAFIDDDAVVDRCWFVGLQKAWAESPDAGVFTGPVLPYELITTAQILFEQRGGFGRDFQARRFGSKDVNIRNYPCNAGMFGAGCNMAFRRDMLIELGGFDEALDTGPPLPGGGDLDIFYRMLRAGRTLAYEPQLLVFHQHRREYVALRRQMYTWGLGMMAYAAKNYHLDIVQRPLFRCMILGWFRTLLRMTLKSLSKKANGWKPDLAMAELIGGFVGVCGEYGRSKDRIRRIRERFG
jgi:glycosyltransferase involved in cell wall biosynthesis